MILARSGCLTIVVVQHSTQPRAALDGCSAISDKLFLDDEPIVQTLVVALVVVVQHKLVDGLPHRALAEQNYWFQARLLDGFHKALRVSIEIRRAWRQLNRLHSGGFQDLQEFRSEQGIPVMDQISLTDQEAFRSIAEIACHLAHPEPIGIPRDSGELNPTARQVDEEEHQESRQTLPSPGLDGEEVRCRDHLS